MTRVYLMPPIFALSSCEKQAREAGRAVGGTVNEFAQGASEKFTKGIDAKIEKMRAEQRSEEDRKANEKALGDSLPNGPRRK